MLAASRHAAGERLELRSPVKSAVDNLAGTGAGVTVEPGPPVVVHGDPLALHRPNTNVAANAVR